MCCLGIQTTHAREKHSVCSGFPTSTLLLTFHPSLFTHSCSLSFFAVYLYSDLRSCLTSYFYGLLSDDIPRSQRHSGYSNYSLLSYQNITSSHHCITVFQHTVLGLNHRNRQYRLFLDNPTQSNPILESLSLPGSTKGEKNCMNRCFNSD